MKRFFPLAAFAFAGVAVAAPKLHIVGEQLTAVSADGRYVVGTSNNQGFPYSVKAGVYDWLPFVPTDINGDGSVIVGRDTVNRSVARWDNGATTLLENLPFPDRPVLIGAHSDLIAGALHENGEPHAFVWSQGTLTFIPLPAKGSTWLEGITEDGAVVGNIFPTGANVSFKFKNGVVTDPTEPHNVASISAISGDGTAFAAYSLDLHREIIVNASGVHDPWNPDTPGFFAEALNLDGTIAGGTWSPSPEFTQAAVWSQNAGAFPVSSLVNLPPLWRLEDVFDLSHDGRVLIGNAYGGPESLYAGYVVTDLYSLRPIPEPSTYGAGAAALLAALVLLRRHRRRAA